jgi:GrpB-like predicted nucleotidyltransferase (UPF0157 family)
VGRLSMERFGGGPIVILDYDPRWREMFAEEEQQLRAALGTLATTVEHVGSTAVPGLAGKPIIDVLIGVRSLDEARARAITPLEALGYDYISEYERWLPGEMLFRKKDPSGRWTHHVHLAEPSSDRWDEFVLVRDYLRGHEEIAKEYGALKRALAAHFGDDIAGFRAAKAPLLRAILAKARSARQA